MPGACLGLVRVLPASSAMMGCRSPGRAFANNVGIQELPKYQVQDPGEVWIYVVSSTETFLSSRVCSWQSSDPGEAAAHPSGQGRGGRPGASEAPGKAARSSFGYRPLEAAQGSGPVLSPTRALRCLREGSRSGAGAGAARGSRREGPGQTVHTQHPSTAHWAQLAGLTPGTAWAYIRAKMKNLF